MDNKNEEITMDTLKFTTFGKEFLWQNSRVSWIKIQMILIRLRRIWDWRRTEYIRFAYCIWNRRAEAVSHRGKLDRRSSTACVRTSHAIVLKLFSFASVTIHLSIFCLFVFELHFFNLNMNVHDSKFEKNQSILRSNFTFIGIKLYWIVKRKQIFKFLHVLKIGTGCDVFIKVFAFTM